MRFLITRVFLTKSWLLGCGIWLNLFFIFISISGSADAQPLNWVRKSDMVIHRTMLAVAEAGGIAYAIGGYYGPEGDVLLSAKKFIPNINDWERIADMPFPRENHGAVGYSGKVYVFWRTIFVL